MSESPEQNTISQKIRKLLALADGNKNEHERDAAMKLAMELLAKYNLDLEKVSSRLDEIEIVELAVYLKLDPWIRSVLHAACKLYYTDYFMRPVFRGYFRDRKEWHPTFVGTRENINVTIELAVWLMNSIRFESNWLFTEQFERRSFRLGAAHKLHERACQLIDEEKRSGDSPGRNSLVLLRNHLEHANRKHLDRKKLGTFQSRGSYCNKDAYGMGESFGDSVNLGRKSKLKAITMK